MNSYFARLANLLRQRDGHRSYVLRGSAALFATNVAGLVVAFAVQVVIARSAGPAAFGVYSIVLSWVAILLQPARFGMELTALRFSSVYRAEEKWSLLKGLVRRLNTIVGSVSLGIATLSIFVVWLVTQASDMEPGMFVSLVLGFALLPVIATNDIDAAILRGLRRPVLSSVLCTIIRPFLTGLLVLVLLWMTNKQVPPQYCVLAYGVAYVMVRMTSRLSVQNTVGRVANTSVGRKYATREWVSVALPLLLTAGFVIVLRKVDTIMVGYFIGPIEAGYYTAASRLVDLTNMGLAATYLVIVPLISERYAAKDQKGLQQLLSFSIKLILAVTIPIVVALVVLAEPLLSMFGGEFVAARFTMLVLIGGQLVAALTGCVGFLMTVTNNQVTAAKIWGSCAALNLILNAYLIPRIGLIGAAVATAVSIGIANLALLFVVRRRLRVDPSVITLLWNRKTDAEGSSNL